MIGSDSPGRGTPSTRKRRDVDEDVVNVYDSTDIGGPIQSDSRSPSLSELRSKRERIRHNLDALTMSMRSGNSSLASSVELSDSFSSVSSRLSINLGEMLEKQQNKEKKLEQLTQKRMERERKHPEESQIEQRLIEYRKKLQIAMNQKKQLEEEMENLKQNFEDKLVNYELQLEELKLDKEMAEEHANSYKEQLDGIVNDLSNTGYIEDLIQNHIPQASKASNDDKLNQTLKEMNDKNKELSSVIVDLESKLRDLELFKELSLEMEKITKEEIIILKEELEDRENDFYDFEKYLEEVQVLVDQKERTIDMFKSKVFQLAMELDSIRKESKDNEKQSNTLKIKSNDLLLNYTNLVEKVKNKRGWAIEKDKMNIEIEGLSSHIESLQTILPHQVFEDFVQCIKHYHILETSSKKFKKVIKYINDKPNGFSESTDIRDFKIRDFQNRLSFFLSISIFIIESFRKRYSYTSNFKEMENVVKDVMELDNVADRFLEVLQKDNLTEDFSNESTVTISFILTNLVQELDIISRQNSGYTCILEGITMMVSTILELFSSLQLLIEKILPEKERALPLVKQMVSELEISQAEFENLNQNCRIIQKLLIEIPQIACSDKFHSLCGQLFFISLIYYETLFTKNTKMGYVYTYYMDLHESQLIRVQSIMGEKSTEFNYIPSHMFSDISFRQPTNLLVAALGMPHEEVLKLASLCDKAETFSIPNQFICDLCEELHTFCDEELMNPKNRDSLKDTFQERLLSVKQDLSIYENMRPTLEKIEKENHSLKKTLEEVEQKLRKALEQKDELEKSISDSNEKEEEFMKLKQKLKDLAIFKEKYELAMSEENVYMEAIEKMQHDILSFESYAKELEEKIKNTGELPAKSPQRRASRMAPFSSRGAPNADHVDKLELASVKQNLDYLNFKQFQTKVKESEEKLMNTIYNPLFFQENESIVKKRYLHTLSNLIKDSHPIDAVDLTNNLLAPKQQLIIAAKALEKQQKFHSKEVHQVVESNFRPAVLSRQNSQNITLPTKQ